MTHILVEQSSHCAAREALLDRAFGPGRSLKTSERLREGRLAAEGMSFVVEEQGSLIGTLRLWSISAGPGRSALLLGPLAVDPACQGQGLGGTMIRHAIQKAKALGHGAIMLVGDAAYYERFGFTAARTGALWMPGPFERDRLLALELQADALKGASGMISATGALLPRPELRELILAYAA